MTNWVSKSDAELDEAVARAKGWPTLLDLALAGATSGVIRHGVPLQRHDARWEEYSPTSDWRDCGPLLVSLVDSGLVELRRSGLWCFRIDASFEQIGPWMNTDDDEASLRRAIVIAYLTHRDGGCSPPAMPLS